MEQPTKISCRNQTNNPLVWPSQVVLVLVIKNTEEDQVPSGRGGIPSVWLIHSMEGGGVGHFVPPEGVILSLSNVSTEYITRVTRVTRVLWET